MQTLRTRTRVRRAPLFACALIFLSVLYFQPVWAQDDLDNAGALATSLFAGNVDSDAFPIVALDIHVVDSEGLPVTRFGADELIVTENGNQVPSEALQVAPIREAPLNLVIALNRATPPADWAQVVAAMQRMLNQLLPGDSVALVAYNETPETLIEPTDDLDAVRAALLNAQPGGVESDFYVAVNHSLRLFEDVAGRRALVVVTDRGNTAPDGGPTVLPALTAAARRLNVAAHIFGFGPAGAEPEFLQLAQGTGGRAVAISVAPDVAPLLEALPALLRQGFRVAYTSELAATGDDHLLTIALRDNPDATRIARGFLASERPVEVRITQPSDGRQVSGNTVITFDAAAPAPIARVTFSLDTGAIITSTESALGGIIWNSSSAPAGDRRLKVTVEDSAGNVGEDEIGLVVVPPLVLQVEMSTPEATMGDTVVVTALVSSTLGGATVEAFVGRTQIGVQANQQGAVPFTVDTTAFPQGRYAIFVRAVDAQGNQATDNAQVLAIAAPANTNVTPANVWAAITAWFGRYWLWIVGALAALFLLWILWLVVRGILAAITRGRRAQQAARARVTPQVRMLITNVGNVHTPYRLRAETLRNDLAVTFLIDGVALLPPVAARVPTPLQSSGSTVVANGHYAPGVAQPAQAGVVQPPAAAAPAVSAGNVADAYKGVSQVADTSGRLLASLGRLIPGPAGAQFRRAGSAIVGQQTTMRRAQGQIQNTMGAVGEVGYYGKAMAPAGALAGAVPPPAVVQAPAPPPKAAVVPNPAFELQGAPAGARGIDTGMGARPNSGGMWVQTPPLNPGQTLGVDIYVAPLDKAKRKGLVTFNVTSGPAEAAGVDMTTDAVSVRLTGAR